MLSQLREEAFILYPRAWNPSTFDQVSSLCRAAGFTMRPGQEAVGMQLITSLVAAGFGVSLVPFSTRLLGSAGVVYRRLQGAIQPWIWPLPGYRRSSLPSRKISCKLRETVVQT